MELRYLCTNCMRGILQNGVCSVCGKSEASVNRTADALPDRYMLASQYYLGKVLGKGGFGITYLAWDCGSQRRVAVKELYPAQIARRDPVSRRVIPNRGEEERYQKYYQRFREEAQLLYQFRNEPTVLDVYRLMEENNTIYYSMEFLTGYDMRSYVEMQSGKKLSWRQLSGYIRQILYTLHIFHGHNLIHRDISPDNIYLTSMTSARLIDFGSVRCYSNNRLTELLKPAYAPLEQYFSNGRQGPWTDIYSLSVVMYHVLTGVLPPLAPDRKMSNTAPRPIRELCPDLPDHVADAITKGMSTEISDRFPNVVEMAMMLFPGKDIFSVPPVGSVSPSAVRRIRCVSGVFRGKQFVIPAGGEITMGRGRKCTVCYPADSPGVSRKHCTLSCDFDRILYIRDEHSTYGTLVSGYRLEPGTTYRVEQGNVISFAGEEYHVE